MTAELAKAPHSDLDRLNAIFADQKKAFDAERHRPIDQRKADLKKIEDMVKARGDDFAKAIDADFSRRSHSETDVTETGFTIATAKHTRQHLSQWAAAKRKPVPMTLAPGKAYVRREPKGVVGIIAPWNYPMQLALSPLVAALGAGCRVMIKPSEFTPRTAELLRETLGELFSEDHVAVIEGGTDVAAAFSSLPFDHLFFTGSTKVGRIVAKAAAENLTPVTLELGGKTPAVVAADFDPDEAAKTIAWGKYLNAGQTCVAPDYAMVPRGSETGFGEAVLREVDRMWPDVAENSDYTAIVSERHHTRLTEMVEEARQSGATVLQADFDPARAGNTRIFAPTVVVNPSPELQLMKEEIFGPVLLVMGHDGLTQAAQHINAGERPLALYIYSKSSRTARSFLAKTLSGGASVNVPMVHLSVEDLPFGGTGHSGQGAYHGEYGFLTFTHERAVFEAPVWHPSRLIQPPYGKMFDFIKKLQGG